MSGQHDNHNHQRTVVLLLTVHVQPQIQKSYQAFSKRQIYALYQHKDTAPPYEPAHRNGTSDIVSLPFVKISLTAAHLGCFFSCGTFDSAVYYIIGIPETHNFPVTVCFLFIWQ